ncbi:MAG: hypothetical protein EOO16_02105 [Chitinophagaceae bacterium]|nr:MAG: hypothetical protein EOO16_02105 [Chitinophagaceae bacterium]
MEIEIFTLADHAQDAGGKLFINGTFDTIQAPQLPLVHPAFTLAMRLRFSAKEEGTRTLRLKTLTPSGKELIQPFEANIPVQAPQAPADYVGINFTLNLYQVKLEEAGTYSFQLFVDDEWATGIKLNVVQRQA